MTIVKYLDPERFQTGRILFTVESVQANLSPPVFCVRRRQIRILPESLDDVIDMRENDIVRMSDHREHAILGTILWTKYALGQEPSNALMTAEEKNAGFL